MRFRSIAPAVALALVGLAAGAGASRGAAAAGPSLVGTPSAVGAPVVGQRLTALRGTWRGAATISYRYQWYRCDAGVAHCSSIHGATAQSYQLVRLDLTHTIALTVSATDTSGTSSAYASAVGPVASAAAPYISTVQPGITGKVQQGQSVQVDAGAWSRNPTSVAYSWLRCNANARLCTPIANASAASYAVTAADTGHALVALLTASSGASTAAALSAAATAQGATGTTTTTTATTGPKNTVAPTVTGNAAQGAQLTATAGTWTGSGTVGYAYQWYRCDTAGAKCSSIRGTTTGTLKLAAADTGHTIGLTVNATDGAGKASAYASLVGPIAAAGAAPIATTQPVVTGTPAVGKAITVSNGAWSPTATTYTFAWQRCNANGRICTAIAGALSPSYAVTAADRGHQLLAIVQAASGSSTAKSFSRGVLVQ